MCGHWQQERDEVAGDGVPAGPFFGISFIDGSEREYEETEAFIAT